MKAVSLGPFIFLHGPSDSNDPLASVERPLLVHEYGHTVQSLILGPLYLLVVGLPSVLWSLRFSRHSVRYLSRGIDYTDRFPENEADRLGELATGEKAH